ncbi:hypothetical protein QM012_009378 [Aureobasidium pullulans]|uniref:Uncharacterized protein n=1 Tax=Aureobasidium pullulans TaxID=5580 RepID=A0ABR0THK1_AURPU
MKYVNSVQDLDQSKHALDTSEIVIDPDLYRSKKKGKSKHKAKGKEKISGTIKGQSGGEAQAQAHDPEVLTFEAGEFFMFLFRALEDGQDIAYLEKKYLGPPAKSVEDLIVIKEEDYKLMKQWSVEYAIPLLVGGVHEIVDAQTRRAIDTMDHKILVERIFENVSAIRDGIHEHLKGSEVLGDYDDLFIKLSFLIMELACCDRITETGHTVPSEADDGVPSEASDVMSLDIDDVAFLQTSDAEREYGLVVD